MSTAPRNLQARVISLSAHLGYTGALLKMVLIEDQASRLGTKGRTDQILSAHLCLLKDQIESNGFPNVGQ